MSRFGHRLIRGLDEIAERATPSSSALADFRAQVAQQTPHEEVVIMMTPDNTQPRRPRRLIPSIVGVTALLGLALAGIVLLRSDGDEVVTTTDTIEEDPTVASAPVNDLPIGSLQWSRVPEVSTPFVREANDRINGVTAWDDGFVAVGSVETVETVDGSHRRAAAWFSEDGTDWSLVFADEPPPAAYSEDELLLGGYSAIVDVVPGGPGLVAAGTECAWVEDCRGKIWTSPDGRSWSKIDIEPGNEMSMLYDIAVGGPGLVVVGEFAIPGVDGGGAVWTSVDGTTWTRVLEPDRLLTNGINLVAAGESGLVAVGTEAGGPQGQPKVWTSPDGLSWSVQEDVPEFSAITATESGFVGVGTEELVENACHPDAVGDCRAVVWTSADGITWTRVPHDDAIFGGGADKQMMDDVTAFDSGVLAVGTTAWYSPDGTTWSQIYQDPALAGEHDGRMNGVAVGESAVVVVGTDGGSYYTSEPNDDPNGQPLQSWHPAATPIVWVAAVPD